MYDIMSAKNKRHYRSRISSKEEQVKIAEHASDVIEPPCLMHKKAIPFFENVISRKAKVDWNQHDVETAALLAMNMLTAYRAHKVIIEEFDGDEIKLKIAMQLLKAAEGKIIALRRTLNIHQASYGSSAEKAGIRSNQAAKLEHDMIQVSNNERSQFLE